jgi:endoglucanase
MMGNHGLRKRLALALAGVMLVGMLSGCGGTVDSSDTAGQSAPGTQTTEAASDTGSEQEAADTQGVDGADISSNDSAGTQTTEDTQGTDENGTQVSEATTTNEQKSENKNPAMESMSAADVVSQMRIGWNIGNTMDASASGALPLDPPYKCETAWGNPQVTQELIDAVLDSGFNVIRIPVSWSSHVGAAPDYEITESWMNRVQEIVDYAYNKGAYVILNLHHETWNDPYYDSEEAICDRMQKIWTQIADRFEDYDEHLIFEGQNEPRKQGTSVEWTGGDQEGWDVVNASNAAFVEAVRSAGGSNPYRMLMIPGYAASSSTTALEHIEIPEGDNRIIVSVHAYTPYNFALNVNGTSAWNNDTKDIDQLMSNLKSLFIDKGIPVIIGEFGAMNKENEAERAEWATYYLTKAKEIGVPCIWWDNGAFSGSGELFGLFDRTTGEVAYPDLLEAMMKATEE